jgi:alpha-galactosidase
MSKITNQSLEIISNKELLAINQDPVIADSIAPFRWGLNVCMGPCMFDSIQLTILQPDYTSNNTHPAVSRIVTWIKLVLTFFP